MPRRWGSRERMSYSILGHYTQVMCWCRKPVALPNPIPLFRNESQRACENCGREHRVRLVVESRAKGGR